MSLFTLLSQDNKSGRSPLVHAVENNFTDMVIFLIEVCMYIYLCMFFSVDFFHTSHIKTSESSLLSQSVPFIFILYISVSEDKDEQISLKSITQFLSVSYGQLLMFIVSFSVCCVFQNGCDVNAQSYSGNTALHSACGRGHIEIVRVLLKNGADSSLKNNHNDTAIMVAKNKKVRAERMALVYLQTYRILISLA